MWIAIGRRVLARQRRVARKRSSDTRVRRVRRDSDAHERRLEVAKPDTFSRNPAIDSAHCAGSGPKTSWYITPRTPASRIACMTTPGFARVGVGRDSGANSFLQSVARRVEQRVAVEHRAPSAR